MFSTNRDGKVPHQKMADIIMSNENSIACTTSGILTPLDIGQGKYAFAVKDSIDIEGYPTRSGSRVYAETAPAKQHAEVVSSLLKHGFHCVGKTTLHELAFGVTGINPWFGTPVNPLYPALIPGGSSSGSATAVAAGEVDFAIGTDTGGSVRMPAACCGVAGFKPTFGLLSRKGVLPASSSLDCVGIFAKDPAMIRTVMQTLCTDIHTENTSAPLPARQKGLALPEIDEVIDQWLLSRGIRVEETDLPQLTSAHQAGITVIGYENWQAYAGIADHPLLSGDVRTRLHAASALTADQLEDAENVRSVTSQAIDSLLDKHHFLLLPALPELPPTLEEATDPLNVVNLTRLVRPFNLTGHPAIVIPAGEINHRPVSLQIVGRKGRDLALIEYAIKLFNK